MYLPGHPVFRPRIATIIPLLVGLISAVACGESAAPTATSPSIPQEQATSPTQGVARITFQSKRDGDWEIYVMDADGGNQIRVTEHFYDDQDPDWSPDGSKIAWTKGRRFVVGADTKNNIIVANTDGSSEVELTDDILVQDGRPDWSPDGTKIAFHSNSAHYSEGADEIFVMNSDGSDPIQLTDNSFSDSSPTWSPAGDKLAFVSLRDGNKEIYVVDVNTSQETRLTDQFQSDLDPAWSPDGSKIAFVSERDGPADIIVMDADGFGTVNLTNSTSEERQPDWSSDGTKITFWSTRDDDAEIYVMDADGANPVNLSNNEGPDVAPSWSPGTLP